MLGGHNWGGECVAMGVQSGWITSQQGVGSMVDPQSPTLLGLLMKKEDHLFQKGG